MHTGMGRTFLHRAVLPRAHPRLHLVLIRRPVALQRRAHLRRLGPQRLAVQHEEDLQPGVEARVADDRDEAGVCRLQAVLHEVHQRRRVAVRIDADLADADQRRLQTSAA